ncbi:hypothetical protein [Serratia ficaria]|uniref:hypothetical protein n=1 Tax=Serratia ficaria TaxID=61651 RepID=UPI0021BDA6DF|nr:hypothetical protein [Serratia ficaria]
MLKLICFMTLFLCYSTVSYAMSVGDFITAHAIVQASEMPGSNLTPKEKSKAYELKSMIKQNLSGIVDGALMMNEVSMKKFGVKMICTTGGSLDVENLINQLGGVWDGFTEEKRVKLYDAKLSTFTIAILTKKYPCR